MDCHKSCKTCFSKGKESCIDCNIENTEIKTKTNGILNTKNVSYGECLPKTHFFITKDKSKAEECDDNCKECNEKATKCTEC